MWSEENITLLIYHDNATSYWDHPQNSPCLYNCTNYMYVHVYRESPREFPIHVIVISLHQSRLVSWAQLQTTAKLNQQKLLRKHPSISLSD